MTLFSPDEYKNALAEVLYVKRVSFRSNFHNWTPTKKELGDLKTVQNLRVAEKWGSVISQAPADAVEIKFFKNLSKGTDPGLFSDHDENSLAHSGDWESV